MTYSQNSAVLGIESEILNIQLDFFLGVTKKNNNMDVTSEARNSFEEYRRMYST